MNSTKGFTGADSKQKLRQGLEDFPRMGKKVPQAPGIVSMGHILLLDSSVPKSKAILPALTWITSAENLPEGWEGQVLAAKKALSIGWDGESWQGWNHSQLVADFPPFSSSLLIPKGPDRRMSLPLVPFFPLVIVKPQGNKDFFFLYSSLRGCVCIADSGGRSATCMASHLPWGHTLPHLSPRTHCICKWLDSNPAFTLQRQRGQGSARLQQVTEGWQRGGNGGRDSECTGGLARQTATAGPTAAWGPGAHCFFSSSTPAKLEHSPATQHRNALCAALAHRKIWLR